MNLKFHTCFKAFSPPRSLPIHGLLLFTSPPKFSLSLGKSLPSQCPAATCATLARHRAKTLFECALEFCCQPGCSPALPQEQHAPSRRHLHRAGTGPAVRWVRGMGGRGRPLPAPPPDGPWPRVVATAQGRPGRGLSGGARPA